MLFYQCGFCIRTHIKRVKCCYIRFLFFDILKSTPKSTPYFFCYPLKNSIFVVFVGIATRLPYVFASLFYIAQVPDSLISTRARIVPKTLFCRCKKMTLARSWPVFAQTFDTPPTIWNRFNNFDEP